MSYTDLPVVHQVVGKGGKWQCHDRGCRKRRRLHRDENRRHQAREDADGRVVGIEAMKGREPVRIKAEKGVVLATGGYSGSTDMLVALCPANRT
ncbi:MAG: FAD-binding protein [Eggerthella lenta]